MTGSGDGERPGVGEEPTRPSLSAVVPTIGASPWLADALAALRRDGGERLEIVLVDQGADPVELAPRLADRIVRPGENLGFAGGAERGIAEATGELVALVNDDLIVEPGWCATLREALADEPRVAAVQGVNLRLAEPDRVDGCGIGWNRSWQAVQEGDGEAAPPPSAPPREIFGVSATAAIYRRSALAAAALPGGRIFDSRLGSYYEDVDLAGRLRAAGYRARLVPAARARHAGSATGDRAGTRLPLVYANRHLVLARLLGRAFWARLPLFVWRDLRDLARALSTGRLRQVAAIGRGWLRAARRLPAFAHRGAPLIEPRELRRGGSAA